MKKKQMGRRSKYDPRMLPIVEKMKREACTDREVAEALGIVMSTFYDWLGNNTDFSNAYNKGVNATKKYLGELVNSAVKTLLQPSKSEERITKLVPGPPDKHGNITPVIREEIVKKKHNEPNAYITGVLVRAGVGGLVGDASDEKVREIVINIGKYKKIDNEDIDDRKDNH